MTGKDFLAALDTLGLSQAQLQRLLDLNKSTTSRWATGGAIPRAVELLILAMCAGKLTLEEIEGL